MLIFHVTKDFKEGMEQEKYLSANKLSMIFMDSYI